MAETILLSLDRQGNFQQSDGGDRTNLRKLINDKVTWRVNDDRIEYFKIISKHGGHPFTKPLSTAWVKVQESKVSGGAPLGDWYYSIVWVDKQTHTEHPVDPKISIKPVIGHGTLILISVALAVTSCILAVKVSNLRRRLASSNISRI